MAQAGVLEDGVLSVSERGTGQGAVISPLLANIYLHYVLDLWAERWRRREARGDMIIVRYADDFIVGFQHKSDAQRFWDDMRKRFEEFSLSLNPDKTRLIEFGRFAADRRAQRGLGKPETFNFLGFTFICERNNRGQFLVKRITRRDRMRATLREIKEELRRRMHQPIPEQGAWIEQVVRGFFAYHAVPTNGAALKAFYYCGGVARRIASRGSGCTGWPPTGFPNRESFIHIQISVSPSHTRGGSRVRESRPHGSWRWGGRNDRPYRAPRLAHVPVNRSGSPPSFLAQPSGNLVTPLSRGAGQYPTPPNARKKQLAAVFQSGQRAATADGRWADYLAEQSTREKRRNKELTHHGAKVGGRPRAQKPATGVNANPVAFVERSCIIDGEAVACDDNG